MIATARRIITKALAKAKAKAKGPKNNNRYTLVVLWLIE